MGTIFRRYSVAIFFVFAFLYLGFTSGHLQAEITDVQQSNTVRVSTTGANSADCGSEAQPCQTIQFAINKTSSGDEILVSAGIYIYDPENDICIIQPPNGLGTSGVVCVVNKELTIKGGFSVDNWSNQNINANETIIDGQGTNRGTFVISTGPTTSLTMDGFTIQNGFAGGIDARLGDGTIFSFGGGMFVDGAHRVNLSNIIFENNRSIGENSNSAYGGSGAGGGLALNGPGDRPVEAILTNLVFDKNEAVGGSGNERGGYGTGGGIHAKGAIVTGSNLTFSNNIARGGDTAGLGRTADQQRGDALGAGASFQNETTVNIQNLTAYDNQAIGGNGATYSGGAFGAGLFTEQSDATFNKVDLRRNIARGGQAVNAWLARGGGAEFIDSIVTVTDIIAVENQAIGGDGTTGDRGPAGGGGLSVTWSNPAHESRLEMKNGLVAGNFIDMGQGVNITGGGGAGLWVQATEAQMDHLTIADNRLGSTSMSGSGILLIEVGDRGADAQLSHSIIANHTGTSAIHVKQLNKLTLSTGLWSNNDTNITNDGTTSGDDTMFSGDAKFVNVESFDYHLADSSTAIDQATSSTSTADIEGRSRQGIPDLGAYEFIAETNFANKLYLPIVVN